MRATYQFIPGIQLNEGFFFDVVKPLIEQHYPGLSYSAALIGYGVESLKAAIHDQNMKNLNLVMVGVEQLTDEIDMTEQKKFFREMAMFFQGLHPEESVRSGVAEGDSVFSETAGNRSVCDHSLRGCRSKSCAKNVDICRDARTMGIC